MVGWQNGSGWVRHNAGDSQARQFSLHGSIVAWSSIIGYDVYMVMQSRAK